jgi:MFS family permease
LLVTLLYSFASVIWQQARYIADPYVVNDDSRVFAVFYTYYDPSLFENDYLTSYFISTQVLLGVHALYYVWSQFADPMLLTKILPLILYIVCVATVAAISWRLAGLVALWSSLMLLFSTDIFLERMLGGGSRSFAFPLLALTLWGLVEGHVFLLVTIAAIGTAIYPVITPVAGLSLAFYLFVLPARFRGKSEVWTFKKRFLVVSIPFLVALVFSIPPLWKGHDYGGRLLFSQTEKFPELGPKGRSWPEDRPPYENFVEGLFTVGSRTLTGYGTSSVVIWGGNRDERKSVVSSICLPLMLPVVALGLWMGALENVYVKRFLLFIAGAFASHGLALLFAPYFFHPQRFLLFPIPLILLVALPVSWISLTRFVLVKLRIHWAWFLPATLTVVVTTLWLAAFGVLLGEAGNRGYSIHIRPEDRQLYAFLSTIDKDAIVAGFPYQHIENVAYLAKRKPFLTRELHLPTHRNYVLELRKRMFALIDAYFAADLQPIVRLRDEFGVDYLIVYLPNFTEGPPAYFEPFTDRILRKWREGAERGFALLEYLDKAAVHRSGSTFEFAGRQYYNIYVLNLHKIGK